MTDPAGDPALEARLRDEIAASGPITFARFMERALYEPGLGYYRRDRPGPGLEGADFLTAPEAHPVFGAALGALVEQAWDALGQPDPFVVTEHGAGTGALAAGLLDGLREAASPLLAALRYRPVEVEPARVRALVARLEGAGLADRLAAGPAGPAGEDGAVLANEVVDALPVHRVVGRPGWSDGIAELVVGLDADGGFAWRESAPTTPALGQRLRAEGVELDDGQQAEVCLALGDWLRGAAAPIARGVVVLVDYAEEPAALYAARRREGTLRTFAGHAVGGDPFRAVGRRDITATVDLAALREAAAGAGLVALGETTQAELLARSGAGELVAAALRRPGATLEDALRLRSALARLMDTRGMGGFRVLAWGRGLPPGASLPALERVREGT